MILKNDHEGGAERCKQVESGRQEGKRAARGREAVGIRFDDAGLGCPPAWETFTATPLHVLPVPGGIPSMASRPRRRLVPGGMSSRTVTGARLPLGETVGKRARVQRPGEPPPGPVEPARTTRKASSPRCYRSSLLRLMTAFAVTECYISLSPIGSPTDRPVHTGLVLLQSRVGRRRRPEAGARPSGGATGCWRSRPSGDGHEMSYSPGTTRGYPDHAFAGQAA
jgi:hypothetical protein